MVRGGTPGAAQPWKSGPAARALRQSVTDRPAEDTCDQVIIERRMGRCMNWFILVLSTTTSEGHQTSGRSPPTSRWTKSTTGYAGFGLSAVLSPPPLHLARAAIVTDRTAGTSDRSTK